MAQNARGAPQFLSPGTAAIASIDSALDRYNLYISPRVLPPRMNPLAGTLAASTTTAPSLMTALAAAASAGFGGGCRDGSGGGSTGRAGGCGEGGTPGCVGALRRAALSAMFGCAAAAAAGDSWLREMLTGSKGAPDPRGRVAAAACELELVGGAAMRMERGVDSANGGAWFGFGNEGSAEERAPLVLRC
jgi:hypothetical protein